MVYAALPRAFPALLNGRCSARQHQVLQQKSKSRCCSEGFRVLTLRFCSNEPRDLRPAAMLFSPCSHSGCVRLLLGRYAISWLFHQKGATVCRAASPRPGGGLCGAARGPEGPPGRLRAPPAPGSPARRSARPGLSARPGEGSAGPGPRGREPPGPRANGCGGGWLCLDLPARLQDGNSRPPRGGSSGSAL